MTHEPIVLVISIAILIAFALFILIFTILGQYIHGVGRRRGYAEGCAATAASVIDTEPCGMGELSIHRATMAD